MENRTIVVIEQNQYANGSGANWREAEGLLMNQLVALHKDKKKRK